MAFHTPRRLLDLWIPLLLMYLVGKTTVGNKHDTQNPTWWAGYIKTNNVEKINIGFQRYWVYHGGLELAPPLQRRSGHKFGSTWYSNRSMFQSLYTRRLCCSRRSDSVWALRSIYVYIVMCSHRACAVKRQSLDTYMHYAFTLYAHRLARGVVFHTTP